jgi:DeoR/GlpR family transcriptional regulator of sugar metabolism
MKSQNKNNKLVFNKAAVTELNDSKLITINGGATTYICGDCILIPKTLKTIVR